MLETYLKRTLPLLFGVIFFVGVVSWLFSKKVSQPLEGLSLSTEALGEGNWDIDIPESSTKEIQTLSLAFKKLGKQLKKREQELIANERLSAVGKFAAGMAHELKNPLNVIGSYAQLIERGSKDNEKITKQVDVIRSEVDRAARIINDLMSFSRQKPMNFEVFALKPFLLDLVENQKVNFTQIKNWEVSCEPESLELNADRENLRQVLINLIENASHAFKGQGYPTLEFKANSDESFTTLKVLDNGAGISQEILPHIFEPFYTTKTVGQGTGLGLAFCKGILQQHNGDLLVQSSSDGTEFTLRLPMQESKT